MRITDFRAGWAVGAGERLQRLARSNLLLVAIDEVGTYRYHHLLQEVLQVELLATRGAASARSLHGRASMWFQEQNRVGEAIRHAIEARMIDDAADLLCRNWYDFVFAGVAGRSSRGRERLVGERRTVGPDSSTVLLTIPQPGSWPRCGPTRPSSTTPYRSRD
jgi:hypothetical protein